MLSIIFFRVNSSLLNEISFGMDIHDVLISGSRPIFIITNNINGNAIIIRKKIAVIKYLFIFILLY